jgi:hypothetical protein
MNEGKSAESETGTPLPVQGEFFDDGSFGVELSTLPEVGSTRHGKYTGAKLERMIWLRDEVVKLLVMGIGVHKIAEVVRGAGYPCGVNSVLAFAKRNKDLVETEKKRVSAELGDIVKLSIDSIKARLIAGTFKPSSVDLGIFIDKKAALDGEAGLVIAHKFSVDTSADAFARRLEEMKKAKIAALPGPAVDSEATENEVEP